MVLDKNPRFVKNLPKTKKFGGKEFTLHDREKHTRSRALEVAKSMRWAGNYTRVVKEDEKDSFRAWVVYIRRK